MLEDTLKEIQKKGYKVLWTHDEARCEIRVAVMKSSEEGLGKVISVPDRYENSDFLVDMTIRALVEKLEKGENHE